MKSILNHLRYLPQSWLFAFFAATLLVLPLQTLASTHDVNIEARTAVANVTAGDTAYDSEGVDAMVDDVVKVQLWYHNMEHKDTGKVAENLSIDVNAPLGQSGKTQTVTATFAADNSNTVTDSTTVNLSLEEAYLEFVPDSVTWRHNEGDCENPNWTDTKLSDSFVTQSGPFVVENAKACPQASVTFLMRVKADVISIVKQVRKVGETEWKTKNTAKAGDTLEYLITIKNEGNTTLKNVVVGDNMPAHMSYASGTTMVANASFPQGQTLSSDNITKGGVDIGNYAPGANAFVKFEAKIDKDLKPGEYTFKNVGVVRAEGMNEFYNTAITTVKVPKQVVDEPEEPKPEKPEIPAEVPDELPVTGPAEAMAALSGSAGLGIALRGYARSKRKLLDSLLDV